MGRGSVWEGRVRLARREEGADPQRSVTDKQRRQRTLPSRTLRAAGLSGLDCVGSGGTDRKRSAPPLTALPNPEFPSRRPSPHFQTGSEQPHPSRIARKLLLLPKNLCERRSAPRSAHPRPRQIIPPENPENSQPPTSRTLSPSARKSPSGRGTDRRELWSLSNPTPRASRESSSFFRRISANAGPSREALTHDLASSSPRKTPPKNPLKSIVKPATLHYTIPSVNRLIHRLPHRLFL